jgi:myo-inositol-1(or 4)-monophosphatase
MIVPSIDSVGTDSARRDPAGAGEDRPVTRAVSGARPQELLAAAVEVVRPAAEQAQRMRDEALGQVATKTSDTDVVTAADQAVERAVVAALHRLRPRDAVLGEEYGEEPRDGATVRWLLDPIDGTVNYLYGVPWYAVSLAAEVDGEVVAGVVRNAANGQEWTAVAGRGAWRDGVRLRGSTQTRLSHALVATGFSYDPARRAHQAAVVAGLIARVRDIRRLGSAALDLCLAAAGAVDAYFEQGLNLWDHAAGGLIAAEAGLTVAGLAGAAPGPRMLVAAPPALFGPLHDRLVELAA